MKIKSLVTLAQLRGRAKLRPEIDTSITSLYSDSSFNARLVLVKIPEEIMVIVNYTSSATAVRYYGV